MRPALVMPYDDNRRLVGEVASVRAREFAELHGMDFFSGRMEWLKSDPWFFKVDSALALSDRPFVMCMDADIIFRKPFTYLKLPKDLAMSVNWAGLCAGFFVSSNSDTALNLLRVWRGLGRYTRSDRYDHSPFDEATIKLLAESFQWVKEAITPIPTTAISSPENGITGSLAHHFIASAYDPAGQAGLAEAMRTA